MQSNRLAPRAAAVAALALLLPLAPSAPAQAPTPVPLAYGVPKDVHFFVHGLDSQTPDPAWTAFERAFAQLSESKVIDDVFELATLEQSDGARREMQAIFDRVLGAFGRVDWGLLVDREIVFAYRLAIPMPEYLYMFRLPADRADEQTEALRAMIADLTGMAGLGPDALRDVERATGTMTVLEIAGAPTVFAMAQVDDVLMVSTSPKMLAWSMKRLTDRDGRGSLGTAERFRASMQHLPEATESILYVDVDGIVGYLSQAVRLLGGVLGTVGGDQAEIGMRILDALTILIEEIDVVDHVAVSTSSDGLATTATSLVKMKEDWEQSAFAAAFADREPWRDWYRYVPADATSFGLDPGFDPAAMMDLVVDVASEVLGDAMHSSPRGEARLARLREILDHVSGETAWASFPQAGPDGCPMGDCVWVLRLDQTDGVLEFVRRGLEGLCSLLRSRGQAAEVSMLRDVLVVDVAAFPWIRPTVGVHEDLMFFASSPAALEHVARASSGEQPDLRANPRFASLELQAQESVMTLSYGEFDAPQVGPADLMSGVGFFLSMIPREQGTEAPRLVGRILTKVAPALRELCHSYTWGIEGLPSPEPGVFLGRSVVRYAQDD